MRPRLAFHDRLTAFLVAVLVAVQGVSLFAAYQSARSALVADAQAQVERTATLLERQLRLRSEELADRARLLALDFALREALASGEAGTMLSAMRNFGERIEARRALFVGIDGRVEADTAETGGGEATGMTGREAGFPDLLAEAADEGSAVAAAVVDGAAYRLVALPVRAPVQIGWIVLATALDDAFAEELLGWLPHGGGLTLLAGGPGGWRAVGSTEAAVDPLAAVRGLGAAGEVRDLGGRESVVRAVPLRTPDGGAPVVALLQYSLDATLRAFRAVLLQALALLASGTGLAVLGVALIARGVTRPVEALAGAARRIEGGEYGHAVEVPNDRTMAGLAQAFNAMSAAVSDREARIRRQATQDARTGLPNRAGLEALLAEAPAGGLLVVGLSRLAEINFTLGHDVGDRLSREVARRLASALPPGAALARMGDDSFAVLVPGADRAGAEETAAAALGALGAPYREGDVAIDVDAAVGIALAQGPGVPPGDLMRRADVALYAARREGRRALVHEAAMERHGPERLSLMGELRAAIEADALDLAYQPKLDIAARRATGVEALVRWTHPRLGRVAPDVFVPLAEETGNVHLLTGWVLRRAIGQAAAWREAGLDLIVSVNLSATDLGDPALPSRVAAMLRERGLPPDRLRLEVTETAAMRDVEAALAVLRDLAAIGCAIAVDDFGSGQSSFAYLRRMPLRELKIDKAFIMGLAASPDDRAIVRAIVELGRALDLEVTAEGVEDAASLDLLRGWACDHAQGYHVARPMPADAVPEACARLAAEAGPAPVGA